MFNLWFFLLKSLASKEKIFVNLVIAGVLFLTLLPLMAGLIYKPMDSFYTGTGFIGGADKMVYFSQIEEASQGHLLFHNLYTSEPQTAAIFSPIWLAIGFFVRLTDLPVLFAFHLFRLLAGFLFLWLIYLFLVKFFKDINWRKLSFLLICLSSGLGVFTVGSNWNVDYLYEHLGTDIWLTEGNTFLSLAHSPLFIVSQILMVVIFWWAIERLNKAKWGEVFLYGLIAAFLGLIHPYDLFIVFPVLGVWFLIKCLKLKKFFPLIFARLLVLGLIASLSFMYFYWLKASDPAFTGWLVQNVTLSPKILNYFIGYGLLFIFYLFGLFKTVKSKNPYLFFLSVWSIIVWFLIFIPFQFQRRLANAWHLPITIIASTSLYYLYSYFKAKKNWHSFLLKYFIFQFIGALLITSTFFAVAAEIMIILWNRYPVYINRDIYGGLLWLKERAAGEDIILSSAISGNIIPAFTGRKVYIGHGHQTTDWYAKFYASELFFFGNNSADSKKNSWLKEQGIDYVFFGDKERSLGGFEPSSKPYLSPVYSSEHLIIYRVK